jgi:hypothetical protein
MIPSASMATRARRLLAIQHLGKAVAAYYGLDERAVVADAARFTGAAALSEIPPDMQKPAVDYLCGRLLLPDRS